MERPQTEAPKCGAHTSTSKCRVKGGRSEENNDASKTEESNSTLSRGNGVFQAKKHLTQNGPFRPADPKGRSVVTDWANIGYVGGWNRSRESRMNII